MKIENISIDAAVKKVEKFLKEGKDISPTVRGMFELLLVIINLLVNRLNLNSRNSNKAPSSDPKRKRIKKARGERKPGGQKGHNGRTLTRVADPDEIVPITIDRRTIPQGSYTEGGYEARQVIDIRISRHVIEYQSQILISEEGKRYTAIFPEGVTRPVQYGSGVKSQAVYMSQYQLIPYNRVEEHFQSQIGISVSEGSLYNFIREAYRLLKPFEEFVIRMLIGSVVINADETGINLGGEQYWLHNASNKLYTYFYPHKKRGSEAMDELGILPKFKGRLCHDHWKPYFKYRCIHVLCNAHHLRELERSLEQDKYLWAKEMKELLERINIEVKQAGGELSSCKRKKYTEKYISILDLGEKECPLPERKVKCRGRAKKTKSRNLLERLREYMDATLRFMEDPEIPFTNNQGENDIRMTKVQQKISGCFRSVEGAKMFCLIRSYLSTCKKHKIGAIEALNMLFAGKLPEVIQRLENTS